MSKQQRKEPNFNKTVAIGGDYYEFFSTVLTQGYVYFIHVPTKTFFARQSNEMFSYARLFWKLFTRPDSANSLPRSLKERVKNTKIEDWAVRLYDCDISTRFESHGYVRFFDGRMKNRMTVNGEQPYPKKFFAIRDRTTCLVRHFWLPENYSEKQVMARWHDTFSLMTKISTQRNCSIELKKRLMGHSLSTVMASSVWPKGVRNRFEFFDCSSDYQGIDNKEISRAVKANNLKFLQNLAV